MDVRNLSGKTALVTGAASGIGRETALALASRGADLVICDLDEAGLADTARAIEALGRKALPHVVDVGDAAAMDAFAKTVHQTVDAVDILVNNAGVGLGASFLDTSLEDWHWILDINVMGVVHGCHYFVPRMVEAGRGGHVVNVASAAAFIATETLNAYSTTKFAVRGFSEALRGELARHGIGVTAVCPGIIDTPITRSSRLRGVFAEAPAARERMVEAYQKRNYTPARVAAHIVTAIGRNRAVAPISPEAWLMWWMKRFTPGLARWVSARMTERSLREAEEANAARKS